MRSSMKARTTMAATIAAVLLASCGGARDSGEYNPDSTTDPSDDATLDVDDDMTVDTLSDVPVDTATDVPTDSPWDSTPDTSDDPGVDPMPEPYPDGTDVTDTDGDTIRDADEGNGTVDTDGDTIPDSEDLDSDADGIPDSYESGDSEPLTSPVDSDFDGTPDFQDLDADDDTIRDSDEGVADVDGDGIPNYRDLDSDGDYLQDFFEAGDADPGTGPVDHDGDSIPDYLDRDSDGDTISDLDESNIDTGEDGTYDYLTLDSDSDTIPDREEAGDYDVSTPPDNCDDDALPNYRDTDSDNDGIADSAEASHGTDRCNADTDGDGVTDLVEIAYGSNPLDGTDSPRTHGDFVFEVPYNDPPIPTVDTLIFSTDLQMADVFFTIDTSGSMGSEITNLRTRLQSVVIPGIQAEIPDTQFGVGRFEDCDYCPHDMEVTQQITSNITAVQNALNTYTDTSCGIDEPYYQNLYAIASGNITPFNGWSGVNPKTWTCTGDGTIGWPCFRTGAVPIIMNFGDEYFSESADCSPTYNSTQAINAINAINARYIGVDSGNSQTDMRTIANGTGSVDAGGTALVFEIASNGSDLDTSVVTAVSTLANQVSIRVDAIITDDPADAVDAVTSFVDLMETNTSGITVMGRTCTASGSSPTSSTVVVGAGGTAPTIDHFSEVLPGVPICFDIVPRMNVTVAPTTDAQIFRAMIEIIGDGFTPLDSRDVYFLVPPVIPGGN